MESEAADHQLPIEEKRKRLTRFGIDEMRQLLLYYLNLGLDEEDEALVKNELSADEDTLASQTMWEIQAVFRMKMNSIRITEQDPTLSEEDKLHDLRELEASQARLRWDAGYDATKPYRWPHV